MSTKKTSKKKTDVSSDESVQDKLRSFYRVAKENLLKLKEELKEEQQRHDEAKEEAEKAALQYEELLSVKNQLEIELKGINEQIQKSVRIWNDIDRENKQLVEEMNSGSVEIDRMKSNSADLVKKHKEEVDRMNKAIEEQVNTYNQKIQEQQEKNNEIRMKIKEAEEKIKEQKERLAEEHSLEGKKNDVLIKDSADMVKFLAEI